MQYIIGIDIGTSNTKAIAFTIQGTTIAASNATYNSTQPFPGHHEQDPAVLFNAVLETLLQVLERCRKETLLGISFSSAMHSVIAVDKEGKPLTNVITWADLRSKKYAQQLKGTKQGQRLYQHTGTPIHPMSPFCKICWIKDNQPALFASAHKFISIKEYIFYRLFDEYLVDYSIASATGLFDIYQLHWYDEALKLAGISADQLSKPVSTLHIVKGLKNEYARLLLIDENTSFIIGASDGCLANLGTNAIYPGDVAITIGTSGAVRMTTTERSHDDRGRLFKYILTDQSYVSGGAINNGGVLLRWYAENFLGRYFTTADDFNWFVQEASTIPAGCEGLIFLPYIQGERAPVWDADAKGVFFGIHSKHTQAHFMRAIIEGICFALYEIILSLKETIGNIKNIYASGGFINSRKWLQILADVFGEKINVTDSADASAVGAAVLGLNAIGVFPDFTPVSSIIRAQETFHPDGHNHHIYLDNYSIYASLYDKLKDDFAKMSLLYQP